MKKKVLFASAVIVLGAAGYFGRHQIQKLFRGETDQERTARVLENDRKVLLGKKASDSEVFGALVRLGDRKNALSKQSAIEHKNDPSNLVRKGAAEALGFFYEDADARRALKDMFADKSEDVRVTALNAIANRSGGLERLQTIRELLNDKTPRSDYETVALYRGLLRLTRDDEKSRAADALIAIYQRSQDNRAKFNALSELTSNLARDPRVLELVRKEAQTANNPSIQAHAIRHLAAIREKNLAEIFKKLAQSPEIDVRMAVVQSLAIGCPDDRYQILEDVLKKEKNSGVRQQAFEQLKIMGGREAPALVERALSGKMIPESETTTARETLKTAEKNSNNPDRCKF